MLAFSLTLAIFGMWSLTGWAVVSLLDGGRNLIRNALLAPAVGASAIVMAIFECNRWGAPVQVCGPIITALGAMAVPVLILRFGKPFPWGGMKFFFPVVFGGALAVGYPMLIHGFNWFSYGNDDMTNYVMAAEVFVKRGYLSAFDPQLLLEGRDMALSRWIQVMLVGERHGSELMLAWVMSLTRLSGHQVFMPVIVAFHLSLICAAGALVSRGRRTRLAALLTSSWVAVSSLVALGTVYQLIAQMFGLGLLAAAGAVVLEPLRDAPRSVWLKRAVLAAIVCAAIGISYPEVLPFLALAFGLTHAIALWRRQETFHSLATASGITLAAAIVLWNNFADSIPTFIVHQANAGLTPPSVSNSLFPYYLVPSGLATFWGFLPVAQPMGEPMLDFAIAAGALLLTLGVVATAWQTWRGKSSAAIAMGMFLLGIQLARTHSDFALYKLAMYLQPFLLGSLVAASFEWRAAKRFSIATIVVVAALGLLGQSYYVRLSASLNTGRGGSFIEVPEASSRHLISELQLLAKAPHRQLIVSDTPNVVLAKVETTYLVPARQEYPAQEYFFAGRPANALLTRWYADLTHPGYVDNALNLLDRWGAMYERINFDMHGGPPNTFLFGPGRTKSDASYSLLAGGPYLSVLNRRAESGSKPAPMLAWMSSEEDSNRLIAVDSDLGKSYYRGGNAHEKGEIALFQLEADYFYPGRSMSGAGRTMLFEVLHPSPGIRLQMEYTASLKADGMNSIPPVAVLDDQRRLFGAVGRGSARLFSPVLHPQTIGDRHYVAIDMGADGQSFPERRTGLMRWYGTSISLDTRRITGFVRDISMVGDSEYQNMKAPSQISRFPEDLAHKGLEYSGIYEDGWIGEESFLRLRQPLDGAPLMVRVSVPGLPRRAQTLRIFADGKLIADSALTPGDNEVRAILEGPAATRRIDLRFGGGSVLPGLYGRTASAQLQFVGFAGKAVQLDDISQAPIGLADHWYPFEKFGGSSFRWVDNNARFSVTVPARQSGVLAIDLEPGPGMAGQPLEVSLALQDGSARVLGTVTGRQKVFMPLDLPAGINYLTLRCSGGGASIPSDSRKLNFRIFALAWNPS